MIGSEGTSLSKTIYHFIMIRSEGTSLSMTICNTRDRQATNSTIGDATRQKLLLSRDTPLITIPQKTLFIVST